MTKSVFTLSPVCIARAMEKLQSHDACLRISVPFAAAALKSGILPYTLKRVLWYFDEGGVVL